VSEFTVCVNKEYAFDILSYRRLTVLCEFLCSTVAQSRNEYISLFGVVVCLWPNREASGPVYFTSCSFQHPSFRKPTSLRFSVLFFVKWFSASKRKEVREGLDGLTKSLTNVYKRTSFITEL